MKPACRRLTSPADGSRYNAPASVTLTANASDSDGTIQKVDFYYGGTNLITTVTTPPYTVNWTSVPQGSYSLTAVATDNLNATTTSAPVTITVNRALALNFIEVDHLNTPRLIEDSNQQVVWRWDQQEPFGDNVPDENPSGFGAFEFPLRFPGQYADKETNLAYNYFRDYDSSIGRYAESDPIGLKGGLATYAYVLNPLSYDDPVGLAWGGAKQGGYKKSGPMQLADCGPEGNWRNWIVLNNPAGFPFQQCCDAHDKCFDNCHGPDKLGCDMAGCNCYLGTCKQYAGYVQSACQIIAREYCYRIMYSEISDVQFQKSRKKCEFGSCKPQ